jgi:pantoate--beta-alanine ligase
MSSRNMRLSAEQLALAPTLFSVLTEAKISLKPGSLEPIQTLAIKRLTEAGFRPDYFEFAKADSLQLVDEWNGSERIVALVAAFLGEVRLIDNMILN